MMAEWVRSFLDIVLIGCVAAALVQATRLLKSLQTLRESRTDMARFVQDFNASVVRAETSIRNLKTTARESGDDLEKLLDKSVAIRDELNFLCDSADQLADRLTKTASSAANASPLREEPPRRAPAAGANVQATPQRQPPAANPTPSAQTAQQSVQDAKPAEIQPAPKPEIPTHDASGRPTSRAERDLLRALQDLS